MLDRVLQTPHGSAIEDVPRRSYNEQVAKPLVKENLRRHTRVRAGEDCCLRRLLSRNRATLRGVASRSLRPIAAKTQIACLQVLQRLVRGNAPHAFPTARFHYHAVRRSSLTPVGLPE